MPASPILAAPILADVGVLALVPEAWGDQWQVRHQVLTRLSEYFEVLWVNPPRSWQRSLHEVTHRPSGKPGGHVGRPGFSVYDPEPWLPQFYRPEWLAQATSNLRLARAASILQHKGCTTIILHLWRPEFAPALDRVRHALSCYQIDDEYSFSPVPTSLDGAERRLIERVDQVFVHSPGLLEKKGEINPHTDYMPNGVDYEAFARRAPEPADLSCISRPRVGYVGIIKKHLDWALLRTLALRHSAWSFVFLGPLAPHPELPGILGELSGLPNVHMLPGRSSTEIAAYPQHFDACIMPYQLDDFARFGYPLKLHEYLASGSPVVGVRMRTLTEFRDVIGLAETVDDWSEALARALAPEENTAERRAERQAVARAHDWNYLVSRMARRLIGRLGPAFESRLDRVVALREVASNSTADPDAEGWSLSPPSPSAQPRRIED